MQNMIVGNPLKLIVKFSIPLLISNFFQQLYSISDIILVGRLIGIEALAAVGAAAPLFFFIVAVSLGFTGGLTIITAQAFGAKNYAKMRRSVATATILSTSFTILFSAIIYMSLDNLLEITNVPSEIYADCKKFLSIICLGVVFIVAFNLLSGFMRALGDSKTPLYFLIATTLINIILNVIFIYYCKMGVAGSALGTVVAMLISVICCTMYMLKYFAILKPQPKEWKLDKKLCKEHLIISIPMALHFSIIALSVTITQTICNKFGFVVIAAMTTAMRLEQLAVQPMISIGIAMATYVAQNYGARKIKRIRKGVQAASLLSFSMSILLALFVFTCGRQIIGIFIEADNLEPEIADKIFSFAQTYMNISVIFYFSLGQIFIFRNSCQGMGNSIIPLLSGILELIIRSSVALYWAQKYGFIGFCWASPAAWIGGASVVAIGYFYMIRKMARMKKI